MFFLPVFRFTCCFEQLPATTNNIISPCKRIFCFLIFYEYSNYRYVIIAHCQKWGEEMLSNLLSLFFVSLWPLYQYIEYFWWWASFFLHFIIIFSSLPFETFCNVEESRKTFQFHLSCGVKEVVEDFVVCRRPCRRNRNFIKLHLNRCQDKSCETF